ncbi:hypothetical protein [Halomontanus rarus]|uniref:hypothetical protein n=1 Tax=Halomontanus rarus TaxID=3034020 RepID=UPI001A9996D2
MSYNPEPEGADFEYERETQTKDGQIKHIDTDIRISDDDETAVIAQKVRDAEVTDVVELDAEMINDLYERVVVRES